MPELPEVEHARRCLARWTRGRTVVGVAAPDPAAIRGTLSSRPSDALPDGVERVRGIVAGRQPPEPLRIGKRIGWPFDGAGLLLHLGMTGKWVRREGPPDDRHARVGLLLDDGSGVWLVDSRRFACVTPVDDVRAALSAGLGPDALTDPLPPEDLASTLRGRRPIKVALMDQARIAGIGNIQALESLWRAGIDPATRADRLAPEDWARLARAIPAQLEATLAACGDDEVRYVTEGGDAEFAVYQREGAPCLRCGGELLGSRLGGRTTTWCPRCQPPA